ncbi:MAG: hypothetical protein Q9167_002912 [Letrouitia subvulpina]
MAPVTALSITPAAVVALLPKLTDADGDIRYMSLNDLHNTLKNGPPGFLANDYHTAAKTIDSLLATLDDVHGEVQNQAIKCLGVLTSRVGADILSPLVEKLSTLKITHSIDSSIPATALRTFITSFPRPMSGVPALKATQDAYSSISKVLIPRLVGYIIIPHGIKNTPQPPPAMLEIQPDNTVDTDAIDVLIEVIRSFGPMLQDPEKKALQKSTLAIFDHERVSGMSKKKTIVAISLLAIYMSDSLLNSFILGVIGSFRDPNLTLSQRKLLVNMIGSLVRSIPQRLGSHLKTLAPFILSALSEGEYQLAIQEAAENGAPDPEAEEVREAALIALEGLLTSCSNDMRPFTTETLNAALRYVSYDPNITQDDDEEMGGTQSDADEDLGAAADDDEEGYFEEEGAMSDNDDASWKIRRCAAKSLYAIISTRSGDLLENGILYHKVAPVLIDRFKEREENVRNEVLNTLTFLVRKTSEGMTYPNPSSDFEIDMVSAIEARSRKRRRLSSDATLFDSPGASLTSVGFKSPDTSPPPTSGPKADLARLSLSIIRGVSKLLKQSSLATRQAVIILLREMVVVQRGGLSDHFSKIAEPLIEAIKPSASGAPSNTLGSTALATGSKLRIEALQLLSVFCDSHSSRIMAPYIANIIPNVTAAAKDKYYKVSSEALGALESLLKALTPPRSGSNDPDHLKYLGEIYDVVYDRVVAIDADLEVRQKAIHALGVLLARTCGVESKSILSTSQRSDAVGVLLDRLKNETTRLSSIQAIDILLTSAQDKRELQADWIQNVTLELGAQLRKANRRLRGASLTALRDLVANPVAINNLNGTTIHRLTTLLHPLINAADFNLLGTTLIILSRLVNRYPKEVVDRNLNNALCNIVLAPIGGSVLDALLILVKSIGEQGIGQPLMHGLLQDVGVNGDPSTVGKAIGTLLVAGGSTVGVKMNDFVTELQSATDDKRKCLALSVLGEAGLRLKSSSTLEPSLFTRHFNSKSQQLPRAAAVALGRAGAGNIKAYLPVILSTSSNSSFTQYLSLHAIKEILQSTGQSRTDISPYTRQIWENLLAASQAEDNKAVGAECIGRLTVIEPKTFLPLLQNRLQDPVPTVRGTVIQAIRFTLVDSDDAYDEILNPVLVEILTKMLNDPDLENRRLALGALNSATHNKADIVIPHLSKLVPLVIKESKIKLELVREVQMGPFKHKVDDGLEVRKSAYETLYSLMDSAYSRINSSSLFDRIIDGLNDEHEIKVLCNLMLTKLIGIDPDETARHLDPISDRYRTILSFKPKENAVKQEVEKLNEANKGVLKVTLLLQEALAATTSSVSSAQGQAWKGYWDWVGKEFRTQLASAEQELKNQAA